MLGDIAGEVFGEEKTRAPMAGPKTRRGPPIIAIIKAAPERLQCNTSGETKAL
jgi:hypothetical protein